MTIIKYLKYIVFGLPLVLLLACNEKITDSLHENKLPETHIALLPDSVISQQKSILNVNWWGDDSDGLVIGYYFKWEGIDEQWSFTTKNDSTFYLPIGSNDTNYVFKVMAVDNSGNGRYDDEVYWNGVSIGPEPYEDQNGDGKYTAGEIYYDIGGIDPTFASLDFPIKNTAPEVSWRKETFIPAESYPVISLGWNAEDIDGNSSITNIRIALNDTSNFVNINGNIRFVTLKIVDYNSSEPMMQLLVNGSDNNILDTKLGGIKLNDNNRIYLQAEDISGAVSNIITLPDSGSNWFVKKPSSEFLIVDDYPGTKAKDFYNNIFQNVKSGKLTGMINELDIENSNLPYANTTLAATFDLFKYIYWYSTSRPSLELINSVTQKFIQKGGKIGFSLTFEDSSETFMFDVPTLQTTFPIQDLGEEEPLIFLTSGAEIIDVNENSVYPTLKTSSTIGFVRTYIPNEVAANRIYDLSSSKLNGTISFIDKSKSLFFIGLPLHQCDGNPGTVQELLEKIYFDEFGLNL